MGTTVPAHPMKINNFIAHTNRFEISGSTGVHPFRTEHDRSIWLLKLEYLAQVLAAMPLGMSFTVPLFLPACAKPGNFPMKLLR